MDAEGRGIEAFQAALQLTTERGRKHLDVSGRVSLEVLILEGAESLGLFESSEEKEDLDLRQAGTLQMNFTREHIQQISRLSTSLLNT